MVCRSEFEHTLPHCGTHRLAIIIPINSGYLFDFWITLRFTIDKKWTAVRNFAKRSKNQLSSQSTENRSIRPISNFQNDFATLPRRAAAGLLFRHVQQCQYLWWYTIECLQNRRLYSVSASFQASHCDSQLRLSIWEVPNLGFNLNDLNPIWSEKSDCSSTCWLILLFKPLF